MYINPQAVSHFRAPEVQRCILLQQFADIHRNRWLKQRASRLRATAYAPCPYCILCGEFVRRGGSVKWNRCYMTSSVHIIGRHWDGIRAGAWIEVGADGGCVTVVVVIRPHRVTLTLHLRLELGRCRPNSRFYDRARGTDWPKPMEFIGRDFYSGYYFKSRGHGRGLFFIIILKVLHRNTESIPCI